MSEERTLVLNSSYQVLGIISWRRAITLIYEAEAETLEEWDIKLNKFVKVAYDRFVSNYNKKYVYQVPAIIRLINNNTFPKTKKIKFSKLNVLYRDNFTCCFCGYKQDQENIKSKKLTIDHVHPVSKGGETSFENCVTACRECNSKKGNMSIEESGMKLIKKPFIPSIGMLMKRKLKNKKVHPSWNQYLYKDNILF